MAIDSTQPLSVQVDNIVTDLNNKADRDFANSTVPYVVSREKKDFDEDKVGIVEIWSDGYCVQTGYSASATATISLSQEYKDTSYLIFLSRLSGASTTVSYDYWARDPQTNSFEIYKTSQLGIFWRTEGYIR